MLFRSNQIQNKNGENSNRSLTYVRDTSLLLSHQRLTNLSNRGEFEAPSRDVMLVSLHLLRGTKSSPIELLSANLSMVVHCSECLTEFNSAILLSSLRCIVKICILDS